MEGETQFIIIPADRLDRIEKGIYNLERSLDTAKSFSPRKEKEWLPKLEFQQLVSWGNTKYHHMHTSGKLPAHLVKKIGRKVFVHATAVDLFFEGDLQ